MQQVGGRKLKTRRYKGGVEDDNQPLNDLENNVMPEVPAPIAQDLMPEAPTVSQVATNLALPNQEEFKENQSNGEVYQLEYVATDPITGIKTILSGGYKIKQKGGLLGFGPSAEQTIEAYKKTIEIITQINNGENPSVMSNGIFRPYNDLDAKEKTQQLQQFTKTILAFMQVLNKNPDLVKSKMVPSSGGKKSKKQRGGADEMIFSKMYNTQGLIEDTNDPIQNALAYNNTADQIPQPFSSGSSGAASYTSGIDPTFLQDVLPVLGMVGGKKKSKRNHK
jgi:hypothetical protein